MTPAVPETRYRFGRYELDSLNRRLLLDGAPVGIPWRCLDALTLLVEAQGEIVDRQVLFRKLWPEIEVEETSLTKVMSQLRRTLSSGDPSVEYLETVPRLGYRLAMLPTLENHKPGSNGLSHAAPIAHPTGVPVRRRRVVWAFAAVAAAVAVTFAGNKVWAEYSVAAEARRNYVESQRLRRLGDPVSILAAVDAIQSAVKLRPQEATYYARLAETLSQVPPSAQLDPTAMREAAERSVQLDPRCAGCQAILGFTLYSRFWDWKRAGFHLEEALKLAPRDSGLQGYMAMFCASQLRLDQALHHANESVRIAPFFATGHYIRSTVLYLLGRRDESLAAANRSISLKPGPATLDSRAVALLSLGRETEAVRDWAAVLDLQDTRDLEAAHQTGGIRGAIGLLLDRTSGVTVRRGHSYRRARWRMHLGDASGALEELEVAADYRHFNLIYMAADPAFSGLRSEPRFLALLARTGLQHTIPQR